MEMIKRINRQSIIVLLIAAAFSAFMDWKKLPLSILIGGALALANLKGIHWGVSALINPEEASEAKGKLVFFSMFRLLIVFVILAVMLYFKLVNIFAVLIGLTIVFVIIMKEGLIASKKL